MDTVVRLRAEGLEVQQTEYGKVWTRETFIEACRGVDFVLYVGGPALDEVFFEACRHLKGISLTSVGYDHVNLDAATRFGIPVSNTPDVLSGATADVAFLLMLAVSRKALFRAGQIPKGEWKQIEFTAHLGVELYGKTLGIFGLGRIGVNLAQKAKAAYAMDIIYHNRNRNREAERALGAVYVDFDTLLERSDVLSVHTNLTAETAGKFNAEAFRKMKKSAIFINTARGGIHDEVDLSEALSEGEIWGAGLDVTNPEPMMPGNPLLSMPRVCVFPHIGSATVETRKKMAMMAADNLISAKDGMKMPQVVNRDVYSDFQTSPYL